MSQFNPNITAKNDPEEALKPNGQPPPPEKATEPLDVVETQTDLTIKDYFAGVSAYQQKKTIGQGMLVIALLLANITQIRYVLALGTRHPCYLTSLILIGTSIALQLPVGACLIWQSRNNLMSSAHAMQKAETVDNWLIFGIFAITVVNVFITAFGTLVELPD